MVPLVGISGSVIILPLANEVPLNLKEGWGTLKFSNSVTTGPRTHANYVTLIRCEGNEL